LEEALQETVNSVSVNERLLHEQTNKSYELEVELANMKIENTVTNTKNASLILSLSERDIALSYYRNDKKKMMAEVLEMKYVVVPKWMVHHGSILCAQSRMHQWTICIID
jgi:hypothetical protein